MIKKNLFRQRQIKPITFKKNNRLIDGIKIFGSKLSRGGKNLGLRTINAIKPRNSLPFIGSIAKFATRGPTIGLGLAVGAVGMMTVGMIKGASNSARDQLYDRYLQDTRYSRNMLANTRVGQASNRNSMLNKSGTDGLGLALSATRHGRY